MCNSRHERDRSAKLDTSTRRACVVHSRMQAAVRGCACAGTRAGNREWGRVSDDAEVHSTVR